jgi:hypothetical protein
MSQKINNYTLLTLLSVIVCSSSAVSANSGDRIFGAVVGGFVGSVLADEVYGDRYHQGVYPPRHIRYHALRPYLSRSYPPRYNRYQRYQHCRGDLAEARGRYEPVKQRRHTSRKKTDKRKAVTVHKKKKKRIKPAVPLLKKFTDAQKIQKALLGLGLYQGAIDGELGSYETHAALKKFDKRYEMASGKEMDRGLKRTLIALGELFLLDRVLIAKSHTKEAQVKQLQAALKIHGFYSHAIDGRIGEQTRKAIVMYKKANQLDDSQYLDLESKYHLVTRAKAKNESAIDTIVSSLQQKQKPYVDGALLLQTIG